MESQGEAGMAGSQAWGLANGKVTPHGCWELANHQSPRLGQMEALKGE